MPMYSKTINHGVRCYRTSWLTGGARDSSIRCVSYWQVRGALELGAFDYHMETKPTSTNTLSEEE
jgi:hypothetical protein